MDLTLVILCSTDTRLSRCLESIPAGCEVLLILNNPSDEVVLIAERAQGVRVERIDDSNLGRLRQAATKLVDSPAICYVDSDCVLTPGTVEHVREELDSWPAVSVPMRYESHNLSSAIVARCRLFTTPDDALMIPAAFRINLQERIGGYLYDAKLAWGEDSDPAKRLARVGVPFGISRGLVLHRSLGIREDAASARRLGRGRHIRERSGLETPRSFVHDLFSPKEIRLAIDCVRQNGFLAGLYHALVWRPSYKFGYWRDRWLSL